MAARIAMLFAAVLGVLVAFGAAAPDHAAVRAADDGQCGGGSVTPLFWPGVAATRGATARRLFVWSAAAVLRRLFADVGGWPAPSRCQTCCKAAPCWR